MKIVIFGLTISSSWGNGHATLWRGLCNALAREGHRIVFFERDVPYYANTRDWNTLPGGDLVLYDAWASVRARAARELADADAAIVTSYCPDALSARALILDAQRPLAVFYDLDTPVTLAGLARGDAIAYLDGDGLRAYELVLSYTGGPALVALRDQLGACSVHALYGHVDPDVHRPIAYNERYRADLSWLGTYAEDRQQMLERLFVEPARRRPQLRFLIAGAQYPPGFPWGSNVYFLRHLPPNEHAAFLSSSRLTLNVTRAAMAGAGWCPSGRLFEAAACGAAILSDSWDGLEDFYQPGAEILIARGTDEALAALDLPDAALRRIGRAARERTLQQHTSQRRARQLVELLERAIASRCQHLPSPPIGPELATCGA